MLCSKLHRQRELDLIFSSYEVRPVLLPTVARVHSKVDVVVPRTQRDNLRKVCQWKLGGERRHPRAIPNPESRIPISGIRIPESGTRNLQPETRDPESKSQNPKPETQNPNPETES